MKKIIALAACAVILLSACSPQGQPNPSPSPEATPVQTQAPATPSPKPEEYVQAAEKSAAGADWSIVSTYKHDMDGDGTDETIQLATSAQKDKKGRVMLDDSQKWALEMLDGNDVYTLYQGTLSNGCPYFEVYQDAEIKENYVRLFASASAQFIQKDFQFIKDKRAFKAVEPLDVQNLLFSSIPYYE